MEKDARTINQLKPGVSLTIFSCWNELILFLNLIQKIILNLNGLIGETYFVYVLKSPFLIYLICGG